MIEEIERNLLKDEEILWKNVKIQNLIRRMVFVAIFIIIFMMIFSLFLWIFSIIFGGVYTLGIIMAYRAKKMLGYSIEDLTNYEVITILTTKHLIKRDMQYFYKMNTPSQEKNYDKKSDVVFIDLGWVEKAEIYIQKKKRSITFFLNKNIIISGPPMIGLKVKSEQFEDFWNKITSLIPLEKDESESRGNLEYYNRKIEISSIQNLNQKKNDLDEQGKHCPHCGKTIGSEDKFCKSCEKDLN